MQNHELYEIWNLGKTIYEIEKHIYKLDTYFFDTIRSIYNMGDDKINIKSALNVKMYAVNHKWLYVDLK